MAERRESEMEQYESLAATLQSFITAIRNAKTPNSRFHFDAQLRGAVLLAHELNLIDSIEAQAWRTLSVRAMRQSVEMEKAIDRSSPFLRLA